MLGLALMARDLAERRRARHNLGHVVKMGDGSSNRLPRPRPDVLSDPLFDVSREYYSIIDRLSRGGKP
jgi:hypothetical protein